VTNKKKFSLGGEGVWFLCVVGVGGGFGGGGGLGGLGFGGLVCGGGVTVSPFFPLGKNEENEGLIKDSRKKRKKKE